MMRSYNDEIKYLVAQYNDANDTEIYSYEERMDMITKTKARMEDVASRYDKTYREVLNDVRSSS